MTTLYMMSLNVNDNQEEKSHWVLVAFLYEISLRIAERKIEKLPRDVGSEKSGKNYDKFGKGIGLNK